MESQLNFRGRVLSLITDIAGYLYCYWQVIRLYFWKPFSAPVSFHSMFKFHLVIIFSKNSGLTVLMILLTSPSVFLSCFLLEKMEKLLHIFSKMDILMNRHFDIVPFSNWPFSLSPYAYTTPIFVNANES